MPIMNEFKIAGVVAGAALLSASSVALAAPAPAANPAQDVPAAPAVQVAAEQACQLVAVSNVQGTFSFDQARVTPNAQIKDVFVKASATLCNTFNVLESALSDFYLSVGGEVPSPYSATVDQIAEEEGSTSQLMGCSCTANSAGGWAVAQARVEGVSVASIAQKAGL